MKKIKYLVLISFLLINISNLNAADQRHQGMMGLYACEDASISNSMSRVWLDMFSPEPNLNESEYLRVKVS